MGLDGAKTMNVPPPTPSKIDSAMNLLEVSISDLEERLNTLYKKIEPIFSLGNLSSEVEDKSIRREEGGGELYRAIMNLKSKIDDLEKTSRTILEAIEL